MGLLTTAASFVTFVLLLALSAWIHFSLQSPSLGWQLLALGSALGGLLIALRLVNQSIKSMDIMRITSKTLLKLTAYTVLLGVVVSAVIVGLLNLNTAEATGVFTGAAEALGFIGLSLVELTIFLAVRRPPKPRDPALSLMA